MQKITEKDRVLALKLLRRALPEGATVRPVQSSDGDLVYRVDLGEMPGFTIRLTLEQEPHTARFATPNSQRHLPVPVLVLPGRKSGDRESLRRTTRGFIDLSGAVFLRLPGFYLDRTDLPRAPRSQTEGPSTDPYTDKASRIARTLLAASTRRRWSTQALASEAHVDASTASRTIREFRRRELVRDENPGQGRRSRIWVPEPEALLRDWARSYSWTDNRQLRVAAPIGAPWRSLKRMGELLPGERWALSLQAGASLVALHADFDVVHVYVDTPSLEAYAIERGWEASPSGKLCLLEPRYAESVWYMRQTTDGLSVVSTVQLVLDLWHYPVRGREQAEHLIEMVMRPVWDRLDDSV